MVSEQLAPRLRDAALDLRLSFIEHTPLFRGVCAAQCRQIADLAHDRRIRRRETFCREAEPASDVYVLFAGRLKLTQLCPSGQQVILRLVGPGELFGGLGLLPGGSYSATAEALEPSHALCWERRRLETLLEHCPPMGRNALRILAERLRGFEERYRELATERVAQRLARALLRLVGQVGRPTDGSVLIGLSREDLAQLTGTTLFTVSRLLSDWESRGVLEARREAVVIGDTRRLIAIAEESTDS